MHRSLAESLHCLSGTKFEDRVEQRANEKGVHRCIETTKGKLILDLVKHQGTVGERHKGVLMDELAERPALLDVNKTVGSDLSDFGGPRKREPEDPESVDKQLTDLKRNPRLSLTKLQLEMGRCLRVEMPDVGEELSQGVGGGPQREVSLVTVAQGLPWHSRFRGSAHPPHCRKRGR